MKSRLQNIAAAVCLATTTLGAAHAADVGISLSIAEPGTYGRVDIGAYPSPVLASPAPVIIDRRGPRVAPVYLWVPPAERVDWARHCAAYRACGAPVYFVEDHWYREHVLPGHERRVDRREDRRDDREDRREDRRGG